MQSSRRCANARCAVVVECNSEVPRKDFVIEEVKGKSRVLNLKANIEIPTRTYQVEKMCKDVCQKVGACPNLVSMQQYLTDDGCPADCQNRPKSNFLLSLSFSDWVFSFKEVSENILK